MSDVADLRTGKADRTTALDALVVGAGFAGLYQLLCLRNRLGLSVKILEAGGGVGRAVQRSIHDAHGEDCTRCRRRRCDAVHLRRYECH